MRLPFLNSRAIVLVALLAMFWVALAINAPAGAQGRRIPKRAGHINDFAEVVDAPTKQRLEKVLENLKQKTGVDFVVVTVKTSGNEDLYDYSVRVASSWSVGPASREDSVLLVIASESANFMTHVSSTARSKVSDDIISQTGKSLRDHIGASGFNLALVEGLRTFADQLGAKDNFSFATLDPQGGQTLVAVKERPRTVDSPVQPSESPQPTPSDSPSPAALVTPSATETPTPQTSPEATPTPAASPEASPASSPVPTETPIASPEPTLSPTATPAEVATRGRRRARGLKPLARVRLSLPIENRLPHRRTRKMRRKRSSLP